MMKYSKFNYQKRISYGMQYISSADVVSVKESLKAKMITQGLNVERFEKKLSTFFKIFIGCF